MNENSPILLTEGGIDISFNDVHWLKTQLLIDVKDDWFSKYTFVKDVHCFEFVAATLKLII